MYFAAHSTVIFLCCRNCVFIFCSQKIIIMDSGTYFWQSNGTEEEGIQANIAGGEYVQQGNASQQNEVNLC